MKRSIIIISLGLFFSGFFAFGQNNKGNNIVPPRYTERIVNNNESKEKKDRDILDEYETKRILKESQKRKEDELRKRKEEEEKKNRLDSLEKKREDLLNQIEKADSETNKDYGNSSPEVRERKNDEQDRKCLQLRSEYEEIDLQIEELKQK